MSKGKTLWEMLLANLQGPAELQLYNPLKAKVGSAVTLDEVELRDYHFFIREVREYRRLLGEAEFRFTDYVLVARPLNEEDVVYRLRLVPVDDPERADGVTHHALLLSRYDDQAYSEPLHQAVTDTTKTFVVSEDGQEQAQFWRINDVGEPYRATVAVARKDETETVSLEYWDYWRDTQDAGVPLREYLFVEMDKESGWFQLWRGRDIAPQRVVVY